MRILARLILSLEKLLKNPVSWFDGQSWLLRIILVFLFIPLISVISISTYETFLRDNGGADPENSYEQLTEEISELKKEITRLHDFQMEELVYMSEDINQVKQALLSEASEEVISNEESSVLGVEYLSDKLRDAALNGSDVEVAYVKTDKDGVDVFISPSESAKKITTLEVGSFYPALREKDGWQQIDLRGGQFGWIKKEFIIKFPVNENY